MQYETTIVSGQILLQQYFHKRIPSKLKCDIISLF